MVTASVLNIRQGAGASFAVVGQLRQGENVILLDERGDWLQVQIAAGVTGWVAARYVKFPSLSVDAQPAATASPSPVPDTSQEGRVVAVTDGDTIRVLLEGQEYSVRYIGMDTPEMGQPKAAAWDKNVACSVGGTTVRLEKDVSETDRYGRLLRYVWVGDIMVNAELVRQGYAQAATFPPDVKYQQALRAGKRKRRRPAAASGSAWRWRPKGRTCAGRAGDQLSDRRRGEGRRCAEHRGPQHQGELVSVCERGMDRGVVGSECTGWPACGGGDSDRQRLSRRRCPLQRLEVRAAPAVPAQQCDPCYPDVCIPSVSYDLDCPEVPFCQFRVTCDPHRFDGDHDGLGCEKCR